MQYIRLINGVPESYSVLQLRRDNPQTSFPKDPTDELLAEWGVYPLTVLPRPPIDECTQYLKPSEPYPVDGRWQQHYMPENLPELQAADNVRSLRDRKLAESDWTQTEDAPVDKAAWATYRQELRDIPAQSGFPWSIDWPVKA